MKWEYLISSWLKDLPHLLAEQQKQYINSMALRFCRPLFHFIDSVAQNVCIFRTSIFIELNFYLDLAFNCFILASIFSHKKSYDKIIMQYFRLFHG